MEARLREREKEQVEPELVQHRDVTGEKFRLFWILARKYSKALWSIGAAALIVFLLVSFLGKTKTSESAPPKKQISGDQIRAQNEKVFTQLGISATPQMSDEQIRAQNEEVFKRLGASPTP